MENLILAVVVTGIILGGPLTLFAAIKILSGILGAPKARFAKVATPNGPTLGLLVSWDEESFPQEVYRVRVDTQELVRGGRSSSFSFTFADRGSKKKSFLVPMNLPQEDLEILTDGGANKRTFDRTYVSVEIETTDNQTTRVKVPKKAVQAALAGPEWTNTDKSVDALPPTSPDEWSLLSRIFPWRKVSAVAEAAPAAGHAPKAKAAKASGGAPAVADFVVTKVWIEPGCIVCDACENEAPAVFHVLPDTCVVRENAPLGDALSIKAAAEGCPVDVIKYTSVPKSA